MNITNKIKKSRLLCACLACSGLLAGASAQALEFNVAQIDGLNGFTALGHTAFDFAGNVVSPAGDLNGDGFDDFFLGAYGVSDANKGQVYVLFGRDVAGSSPFSPTINLASLADPDGFVINGVAASERAGTALASIGDVNADGVDDVIIGARASNESTGNFASGAAYVVFGRDTTQMGVSFPNPFELSSLKTGGGADGFAMYGVNSNDNAGISVAGGFDLNGDGIADLAVGADGTDVNDGESGEVYVVFGRDTGSVGNFPQTRSLPDLASGGGSDGFVLRGPSENARAGTSLAFVGDVNDDGFDDLIIGAIFLGDAASAGKAYVIFGRDTSMAGNFPAVFELSTLAGGGGGDGFVLNGVGTDDSLGDAVGAAGDVNGDGIDDIIVGDPGADDNGDGAGQAYVVFGRNSAFPGQFELSTLATGGGADGFVLNGRATGSTATGAGVQVGSAGDWDGDGVGDFFVGDGDADSTSVAGAGEVYVVFGQDTGMVGNFDQVIELGDLTADAGSEGLVIHGQDTFDRIGNAAALAGDIDGDGRADMVIGSSEADPNGGNSGEVYVLFSPGRINTPPSVTAPGVINGLEDTNLLLGSSGTVEITDAESDPQTVALSYDDTIAVLHLDPVAGVAINGNDTDELIISGALADINTALPLVSINPQLNVNGGITALTISSNDGWFVGEGFPFPFFQAVNDPPTLSVSIDPLEILEDDMQNLHEAVLTGVTTGDPEPTGQTVTFDVMNDNNGLFMTQPSMFRAGTNGNVFLRLNPDANGSAMVDFTAMDNGGTANGGDDSTDGQFEIVVLAVNDAPVFNLPGDLAIDEDASPQVHMIWITGIEDGDPEVTQALSFSLENDNMALFSAQPAVDGMGNLTYTAAPDAFGAALVTVTLSDDGGTKNGGVDSSSQNFTITIDPVNDPPSFVIGPNVEATDVDGAVSIPNWATAISAGPNESGQTVSFQVVGNTAPELFSAGPAVSPTGTLTFTPEPGMSGTAMVDLVLMDDGPNDGANVNTSDPQSAMFTIELGLLADIAVSKSNGTAFLQPPGPVVWVITVENLGPEDVEGAEVSDLLPLHISNASWTCAPSGGANCTASGNGDIVDTIDLPAGSQAAYTLTADIAGVEGDVISNTVEVIPPESPVDLNLQNNSATDSDPIALFFDGYEPEGL